MRLMILAAAVAVVATAAWADYDVNVELKNVSGEAKDNWPVVLRVYTVLGRNLAPGSVNPDGFHVYDPAGREVNHALEVNPPDDQVGNDELIFVIPKIAPDQTLTYRVTNTAAKSGLRAKIDVVGSPHNLIPGGGFEKLETQSAGPAGELAGFTGGAQDTQTRRAGKASLALTADGKQAVAKLAKPVPLHKGSWYYFGCWSKTQNVSRFGYQAGEGAFFRFQYVTPPTTQPGAAKFGSVMNQCSTRDWLKCTFEGGGFTDWGVERYHAQAKADAATIEFVLDQKRHYYMEPGKTAGTWWLDEAVLLEQPDVRVRFDQSLQPHVKDGVFVFTRPPLMPLGKLDDMEGGKHKPQPWQTLWAAYPFAHERITPETTLDKTAARGQRVSFCVGVYHTKPLQSVLCDAGLKLGEQQFEPELIEYCPGYVGANPTRHMQVVRRAGARQPDAMEWKDETGIRYFFVTFHVTKDMKPGRYQGQIGLSLGGTKTLIPIVLRVQDLDLPVLRDTYVGLIYNGGIPIGDAKVYDEFVKVYGRSGFSHVMWFYGWTPYVKKDGKVAIDEEKLDKLMKQLAENGVTASVGLYTDIQIDDKPQNRPGRLIRLLMEEAQIPAGMDAKQRYEQIKPLYARVLKDLDAMGRRHPDWPRIIHMNWDEPQGAGDPRMAWTNEILPEAASTLDVQFDPLAKVITYYSMPAFDDPADWSGPELYRWCKGQGKDFGYCGATDKDEANRYQAGMLMIASGAKYFHAWHLRGGHTHSQINWDAERKELQRAPEMINWGDGMNDLKVHRLLIDAIAKAKADGKGHPAVAPAEEYLAGVHRVWNGDHRKTWTLQPYLGTAFQWGCEQWYDQWQERMLEHAAAILGKNWVK